jgi:anthranilate phosphoribosyltransferase
MCCIHHGELESELEHQAGTLTSLPDLPPCDAQSTARYIQAVLDGALPTPQPIAVQVAQIVRLAEIAGMPE